MSDDPNKSFLETIRLPESGDKLFAEGEDWWMNACLNWYHDPSELYIGGYKEAADALIKCVANREGSADSLIFPIVFLYRQYIELRLKSLLEDGRRLLDREHESKNEHRLSALWPEVLSMLMEIWPDGNNKDLRIIDGLIKKFEQVDPRSTAFRYPKNHSGSKSVNLESPRVNLRNLSEVIGAMAIILDGAASGISEYQSYKDDMKHEFRP